MKFRIFRRTSFTVRKVQDLKRLAWRVLLFWKVPHIDLCVAELPLLQAQRSQLRLRRLNALLERQTGGLVAIAVLIIGLADMVRTWNRSLEHMGWLVLLALGAGLAARLIARLLVRLLFLLELLLLRRRIRKAATAPAAGSDESTTATTSRTAAAAPGPSDAEDVASTAALTGSCACGSVAFSLSRRPMLMGTCHCATCRKTGSSTMAFVRRDALVLTAGQELVATDAARPLHGQPRCFCTRCGSALGAITSTHHELPLPANLFSDDLRLRNGFHQFVSEKPAWQQICDGALQFPGARPA